MSTKQSAIAVVPHSNQQSPLSLLHLPLVKGSTSGVPRTSVANIPKEPFKVVFLSTHLNDFKHNQVSFCSRN